MGTSSSQFKDAQLAQLDPSKAVVAFKRDGVAPFAHGHAKEYKMTENLMSLSGDSFTIKDEHDHSAFKVEGKTLTLHGRKKLFDGEGGLVGFMSSKTLSMHRRTFICDAEENVVAIARKAHLFQMSSAAEVWVLREPTKLAHANKHETGHRPCDVRMGGNWRAKNFLFAGADDAVLGKVQRSGLNARSLLGGQDTYFLEVAPHVDAALLVLLVVCCDEMFRDEK
mmetsp:Transcript_15788/g.61697  ORF Transcript_15788/g.61697 Transcript_15788/m.61697 type:complete len:224 (-) Transcript_15788:112-783(-)